MYNLESISGHIDPNQDDAPWQPVDLEPWIDRSNLAAMLRAKEDRELDNGSAYTYRVTEVEREFVDHHCARLGWTKVECFRVIGKVA